jgi:ribose transport system permease protein
VSVVREPLEARARLRALRRLLGDNPTIILTLVFVALFVVTDIVNRAQVGQPFFTATQVSTTFLYAAILGLIAAGQTLVMLTGGVDLSVASTATAAGFIVSGYGTHGAGAAIFLALLISAGIGLLNGVGVAIFRANPLIMTLGVSSVTLGALAIYAQRVISPLVPGFVRTLGSERFFTYIPYDLLVWGPISALIVLGLLYSGFGRMIYAVGDNQVACRLAGVRVWQVLLLVYVLCGVLSGVAGVLLDGFTNGADLEIGAPFLLPSVAAVVIGGTSIFGGSGGYSGTILGALILTVLDSLLTILNASAATKQILYGAIVLALAALYARAVSSD